MTIIDNRKIFLNGIYGDATVTVAAKTTLKKGTVLGLNKDDEIVAYSTDLNVPYTPANGSAEAVQAFIAEPTYILAQDLTNPGTSSIEVPMVRVFESGEVDAAMIVFSKAADATDAGVLAAMKNNGFNLRNVQQMV